MTVTPRFSALLLHEIFPSGPWVLIAIIVLGLVVVLPLYWVHEKYGGMGLTLMTAAEIIAAIVLMRPATVFFPMVFVGAATALVLHLRALYRPNGHRLVDIGLAVAGFWFTALVSAVVFARS